MTVFAFFLYIRTCYFMFLTMSWIFNFNIFLKCFVPVTVRFPLFISPSVSGMTDDYPSLSWIHGGCWGFFFVVHVAGKKVRSFPNHRRKLYCLVSFLNWTVNKVRRCNKSEMKMMMQTLKLYSKHSMSSGNGQQVSLFSWLKNQPTRKQTKKCSIC